MKDLDGALDSSESDWGDEEDDDWRGIEFKDNNTAEARDPRCRGSSVANGFKPDMDIYVEPREELAWEVHEESELAEWTLDDLVKATSSAVEVTKKRLQENKLEGSRVIYSTSKVEIFGASEPRPSSPVQSAAVALLADTST
jgi:hypothetical protein